MLMGLDVVEFVVGLEEAFEIQIPDSDLVSLTTPRLLIDYLHSRLPKGHERRCLSQRAFYAVRQEMVARLGLARPELRPNTELLSVLPSPHVQVAWNEIGESLGYPNWARARGSNWFARTFLPNRPRTLGDAARYVAVVTPAKVKPADEGWSWAEVAAVVAGQLRHHFDIRQYALDDRFVEDLGMD
jgi:hypothetical protein